MKQFFLPACLLFLVTTVSAQDIMNQLGGVATNYTLQIDDLPLEVVDQYIIKRTICENDSGCGEYYHFEFTLNGIRLRDELRTLNWNRYRVAFYSKNGTMLALVDRTFNDRDTHRSDAEVSLGLTCYSFQLNNVPLTVLRHCRTVRFMANP